MPPEQQSVADIFRRAQALRLANPGMPLKDLKARLVEEYKGAPFPPTHNLTIPEQDAHAPEEDWTAGLSLVMRGIQQQDWREIISGITLSLEQTEKYERERGTLGEEDDWHDRSAGIRDPLTKGLGKWMPEELMRLTERAGKK
jgi:hypothetical protein